jgi:hypothetical protein
LGARPYWLDHDPPDVVVHAIELGQIIAITDLGDDLTVPMALPM